MQENDQKITRELAQDKALIFCPKDKAEAKDIQNRLFKMGFGWSTKNRNLHSKILEPERCVQERMVLLDGFIYVSPREENMLNGLLCTADQLKDDYVGGKPAVAVDNVKDSIKGNNKVKGLENEEVLRAAQQEVNHMIGLSNAKDDFRQNIAFVRLNKAKEEMGMDVKPISHHMVLTGNPGTGKTTLALEVAKIYHAMGIIDRPEVISVTRDDLIGKNIGESEAQTKAKIQEALGAVLFIDEAYALSLEDDAGRDYGKKSINTLVPAMENMRDNLIVIFAGYPGPMKTFLDANPGLQSRVATYITFEDPTIDELGQIMDLKLEEYNCSMTDEARDLALLLLEEEKARSQKEDITRQRDPSFGNGRTVRNLVEKAQKIQADRLDNSTGILRKDHGGLNDESYKKALTEITLEDVMKISLKDIETQEISSSQRPGFWTEEDEMRAQEKKAQPVPAAQRLSL